MCLKKISITICTLIITLVFSSLISFATNYYISEDGEIVAYAYGANYSGYTKAIVDSDGAFSNVTKVKHSAKIYKNGIYIHKVYSIDSTSPFNAEVSSEEVADDRSNSWKASVENYFYINSQWLCVLSYTTSDSN